MSSNEESKILSVIEELKANSPLIFEILLTQDMGYEFSALTRLGVVRRTPGMLLNEEEPGNFPEWIAFDGPRSSAYDERLESYLNGFEVTPYEETPLDELQYFVEILEKNSSD